MGDALIGVLVGGFLTLAGLFLTELFRYLRERGAREAGRRRRRDDFQRTTLLEAQEALVDWIQATRNLPGGSRFLAADQEPFDREELARQRLTVLRERLLDDEARRSRPERRPGKPQIDDRGLPSPVRPDGPTRARRVPR